MMVSLGNFRASEEHMLSCASRSALVCRSVAQVCRREGNVSTASETRRPLTPEAWVCVSSESHCLFLDPWTSAPNESTTFSAWFFSRDLFTLESLERRFHITRAFSSQFRKCFHKISGSLSCLNSLRDRKFTTYSRQSKLKNCICKFPERYSLYAFFYNFHSVILTLVTQGASLGYRINSHFWNIKTNNHNT